MISVGIPALKEYRAALLCAARFIFFVNFAVSKNLKNQKK